MTASAIHAEMLVEAERELAKERDVSAALRANVAKRDDELKVAGKRIATLEGQNGELRARAAVAEERAEIAESRPIPKAAAECTGPASIKEALDRAQRAIIAAMPTPVSYAGIEAVRDANGLLRSWKFKRAD